MPRRKKTRTEHRALGAYIKRLLEQRGQTQSWLAAQADIDKGNLSAIINRGVEPELGTLARLARALDPDHPEAMLGKLMDVAGFPVTPVPSDERWRQRVALLLEQAPWMAQIWERLLEAPPDLQQQILDYVAYRLRQQPAVAMIRQSPAPYHAASDPAPDSSSERPDAPPDPRPDRPEGE